MKKPEDEKANHVQVSTAMQNLDRIISDRHQNPPVPFEDFLKTMVEKPHEVLRNVFRMVFHESGVWSVVIGYHNRIVSYPNVGLEASEEAFWLGVRSIRMPLTHKALSFTSCNANRG